MKINSYFMSQNAHLYSATQNNSMVQSFGQKDSFEKKAEQTETDKPQNSLTAKTQSKPIKTKEQEPAIVKKLENKENTKTEDGFEKLKNLLKEMEEEKEKLRKNPVTFEYLKDKPNIKSKISIHLGGYDNISLLEKDFYNKYVKSTVDKLSNFAYKIEWEKEGSSIEFPNCILIEEPEDKIADDLIKMTKDISDVKYTEIKASNNAELAEKIEKALNNAEKHYQETGKRTLLKIHDFETFVRKDVPVEQMEWAKSITTCCSEDYHTTIIFKTRNSILIDDHILQPHRCGLICEPHNYSGETLYQQAKEILEKAKEEGFTEKLQKNLDTYSQQTKTTTDNSINTKEAEPKNTTNPQNIENPKTIKKEPKEINKNTKNIEEEIEKELIEIGKKSKYFKPARILKLVGSLSLLILSYLIVKNDKTKNEINKIQHYLSLEWSKIRNENHDTDKYSYQNTSK